MGDTNAVEFGQAGHLIPAIRHKAIFKHELLHNGGRPPRGLYAAGVIQDDHGAICCEQGIIDESGVVHPKPIKDPDNQGEQRFAIMDAVYQAYGLVKNVPKELRRKFNGVLWGGEFDGVVGSLRPPVPRSVALSMLTFYLVSLRFCTPEILEILGGSFCFAYTFRRPLMSQLSYIYAARRGHHAQDILRMSSNLIRELVTNIILLPLCCTNLRASGSANVYAVDASSKLKACVRAPVHESISRELCRHGITKGGWTHLQAPSKATLHSKGLLEATQQVPEQDLPKLSFVAAAAAKSLDFQVVSVAGYNKKVHINVGEADSVLMASSHCASIQRSVRLPIMVDSLVSGFAHTKGRSSSPALNESLEHSLPTL